MLEAIADATTRLLGDMPDGEEEGANQERERVHALLRRREGGYYLSGTKEQDHGDDDASRPEHGRA